MRVLLDECVHAGVKAAFSGHDVKTVTEIGWRSSKDGPLLVFAQEEFDVFVTIDRNLMHQQNLPKFNIGLVIVRVPRNELVLLAPFRPTQNSRRIRRSRWCDLRHESSARAPNWLGHQGFDET